MFEILLANGVLLSLLAVIATVVYQSVGIARGDQFLTVERRWFGKPMSDGGTVALKGEVGQQARTLGPADAADTATPNLTTGVK